MRRGDRYVLVSQSLRRDAEDPSEVLALSEALEVAFVRLDRISPSRGVVFRARLEGHTYAELAKFFNLSTARLESMVRQAEIELVSFACLAPYRFRERPNPYGLPFICCFAGCRRRFPTVESATPHLEGAHATRAHLGRSCPRCSHDIRFSREFDHEWCPVCGAHALAPSHPAFKREGLDGS